MRYGWWLLFASACSFGVRGVSVGGSGAGSDAGVVDDMATPGGVDGLGGTGDMTPPPAADLMVKPPMPLMPSHVPPHYLTDGTCDLTVTTSIDTDADSLKIDGNDAPSGCTFDVFDAGGGAKLAVLAVHSLQVTGTVAVTGELPLVIVAGTSITVSGTIDGSADKGTPGPGGGGPGEGTGKGGNGDGSAAASSQYADSGGGGAGFATAGAVGGKGVFGATTKMPAPPSAMYGTPSLMKLEGGSGGGHGASEACNGKNGGEGGAGGGAIQLSAGSSITIAASGAIAVGGGGGGGGCYVSSADEGSGGGGGSGGAIFLEAPTVSVAGGLWANGGGGGGGSSGAGTAGAGGDGANGAMSKSAAGGGTSGGTYGGTGGAGGTGTDVAGAPGHGGEGKNGGTDIAEGGGGGGAVGYIVVRSRGMATVDATKISPAAYLDPNLP